LLYDLDDTGGVGMKESRRFGFMLKDVTRLYAERFEQHAASLGLTLLQCRALVHLADNEGVSQVRLAELTDLEPMTLVRILDRMEGMGWLERRADPRDRRVHCLYLTGKARPLLDDIRRLMDVIWGEAFAGVPKRQSDLLMELLEKVRSNFMTLAPVPAAGAKRAGGKA
jgi:MarR family transcriptional regulator, transcriptional regulator for hemolysin